ncbi:Uncharacterised protein [uncultured archaeon]|nr:Uncharacterised protein [uncultured archaeon]
MHIEIRIWPMNHVFDRNIQGLGVLQALAVCHGQGDCVGTIFVILMIWAFLNSMFFFIAKVPVITFYC